MGEKRVFPNPSGHVQMGEKGIRVSTTWRRLETVAASRSPQLEQRIRGMRERETKRLEEENLSRRIDVAVERWRTEHPGQPIPWQIGG